MDVRRSPSGRLNPSLPTPMCLSNQSTARYTLSTHARYASFGLARQPHLLALTLCFADACVELHGLYVWGSMVGCFTCARRKAVLGRLLFLKDARQGLCIDSQLCVTDFRRCVARLCLSK